MVNECAARTAPPPHRDACRLTRELECVGVGVKRPLIGATALHATHPIGPAYRSLRQARRAAGPNPFVVTHCIGRTFTSRAGSLEDVPDPLSPRSPKPEPQFDWDAYANEVGVRLRAVREARGLTQEQLAGMAGLERNQVQNIERNRTSVKGRSANPQLQSVFRLAWALKVSPSKLLPQLAGPPVAHYRATFDAAWPTIEADLVRDLSEPGDE